MKFLSLILLIMLALLLPLAGCAADQVAQAQSGLAKIDASAAKVDAAVAVLPIDPKDRAKYDAERAKAQVWLELAKALLASQADAPTTQPVK